MIDCSHANSSKQHERQLVVTQEIAAQMSTGSRQIFGVMVESHIEGGAQKFTPGKDDVKRFEDTRKALPMLASAGQTVRKF